MTKIEIKNFLVKICDENRVKLDESMKNHTFFKIGGNADFLVSPSNIDEIRHIIMFCKDKEIPYFIMGNGSNLVVRDKGIRGIVIKMHDDFNSYRVNNNIISANAGILLSKIANIALENGLTGLEFASGIPGTLGGAVTMNAGAYDGEMKDVIFKTSYLSNIGEIKTVESSEHEFGYRSSIIQKQCGTVLNSDIQLKFGSKEEIKAKMNDLNNRRKDKQPLEMPSAGSVFKRPEGFFAGKLIEDCGLKGFKLGGAQVSEKHCGFIVNSDNASSKDVLELIELIKFKIKQQFGIEMNTEIKIVGEE